VIEPAHPAGFFERNHIQRIFNNADDGTVSFFVLANGAQSIFRYIETLFAKVNVFFEVFDNFGKIIKFFLILFEQIQNQPFGHFGTDGRKISEVID